MSLYGKTCLAASPFRILTKQILLCFSFFTTFAIALTLCTDVVAEHGSKDEVLFGRQFVERTGDNETYRVETFLAANIEVEVVLARRLQNEVHVLTAQAFLSTVFILLGTCE